MGGQPPCRSDPGEGSREQVGETDPRGLRSFGNAPGDSLSHSGPRKAPASPSNGPAEGPLPAAVSPRWEGAARGSLAAGRTHRWIPERTARCRPLCGCLRGSRLTGSHRASPGSSGLPCCACTLNCRTAQVSSGPQCWPGPWERALRVFREPSCDRSSVLITEWRPSRGASAPRIDGSPQPPALAKTTAFAASSPSDHFSIIGELNPMKCNCLLLSSASCSPGSSQRVSTRRSPSQAAQAAILHLAPPTSPHAGEPAWIRTFTRSAPPARCLSSESSPSRQADKVSNNRSHRRDLQHPANRVSRRSGCSRCEQLPPPWERRVARRRLAQPLELSPK